MRDRGNCARALPAAQQQVLLAMVAHEVGAATLSYHNCTTHKEFRQKG